MGHKKGKQYSLHVHFGQLSYYLVTAEQAISYFGKHPSGPKSSNLESFYLFCTVLSIITLVKQSVILLNPSSIFAHTVGLNELND